MIENASLTPLLFKLSSFQFEYENITAQEMQIEIWTFPLGGQINCELGQPILLSLIY
ncbi:MAG: hypothetical protein DHS20C05_09510 [Hyphococcus sp.]|nr:MAG: hypothetical protein DHS20C05_09510 [Marinicaulis sp.]